MKYSIDMKKAAVTSDSDGLLTGIGLHIAQTYATDWVAGQRNLELEREYPDLRGLFYDIRADSDLARQHAIK